MTRSELNPSFTLSHAMDSKNSLNVVSELRPDLLFLVSTFHFCKVGMAWHGLAEGLDDLAFPSLLVAIRYG